MRLERVDGASFDERVDDASFDERVDGASFDERVDDASFDERLAVDEALRGSSALRQELCP